MTPVGKVRRGLAVLVLCCLAPVPAAAKGTGLIFISNEKSNEITVLDSRTNEVVRTFETCRRPRVQMRVRRDRLARVSR